MGNFFHSVNNLFFYGVQKNFANHVKNKLNISEMCSIMMNTSVGDDPMLRFVNLVKTLDDRFDGSSCINLIYNNTIKLFKKLWLQNFNDSHALWFYQQCSELGFFITSNNSFGFDYSLDYPIRMCQDVFDDEFNLNFVEKAVNKTNMNFGGLDYKGSRVVFVNGDVDPWHSLSITKNITENNQVIFIKGASHCQAFVNPQRSDSNELVRGRKMVFSTLKKWLEQTNN